jgi:excisionase family DNA binding protein
MTTKNSGREPDMKAKEVAEFLNLHVETVRVLARQGKFPGAYKVGPKHSSPIRIPWAAVQEYRQKQPQVSM